MTKSAKEKRQRLIETAAQLAHEKGFAHTSLADLASAAKVPLGNVFYYIKTRDDLALEIVALQVSRLDTMLKHFDRLSTPRQRLLALINARAAEADELAEHGCADGSLVMQLKFESRKPAKAAETLMHRRLDWATAQFRFMGQGKDSASCAVHLISSLQGVAQLAHALDDPELVKREMQRLRQWVVSFSVS